MASLGSVQAETRPCLPLPCAPSWVSCTTGRIRASSLSQPRPRLHRGLLARRPGPCGVSAGQRRTEDLSPSLPANASKGLQRLARRQRPLQAECRYEHTPPYGHASSESTIENLDREVSRTPRRPPLLDERRESGSTEGSSVRIGDGLLSLVAFAALLLLPAPLAPALAAPLPFSPSLLPSPSLNAASRLQAVPSLEQAPSLLASTSPGIEGALEEFLEPGTLREAEELAQEEEAEVAAVAETQGGIQSPQGTDIEREAPAEEPAAQEAPLSLPLSASEAAEAVAAEASPGAAAAAVGNPTVSPAKPEASVVSESQAPEPQATATAEPQPGTGAQGQVSTEAQVQQQQQQQRQLILLKEKQQVDRDRLLSQNRRIQMLNQAPDNFPAFIREGFEVQVVAGPEYVRLPSGLIYWDIESGKGSPPTEGQRVVFNYVGYNESGRRIDSTYLQGRPAVSRMGINAMIPGFEEGLGSMKPGGIRRVIVPPELGPPTGPSTFFSAKQYEVFDIELISSSDCQRRQILFYSDVVCD